MGKKWFSFSVFSKFYFIFLFFLFYLRFLLNSHFIFSCFSFLSVSQCFACSHFLSTILFFSFIFIIFLFQFFDFLLSFNIAIYFGRFCSIWYDCPRYVNDIFTSLPLFQWRDGKAPIQGLKNISSFPRHTRISSTNQNVLSIRKTWELHI